MFNQRANLPALRYETLLVVAAEPVAPLKGTAHQVCAVSVRTTSSLANPYLVALTCSSLLAELMLARQIDQL